MSVAGAERSENLFTGDIALGFDQPIASLLTVVQQVSEALVILFTTRLN
jgi:hypothetical protein